MTFNVAYEATPYFNPSYWDGHSFGYGEVTPGAEPYATRRGAIAAGMILQSHVLSGRAAMEGIQLEKGEEFNPSDHPPGTVVLGQSENIHVHGETEPARPEKFDGLLVPSSPTLHAAYDYMDPYGRHYETWPLLGAVSRTGFSRKHVLYGVVANTVVNHEDHVHFPLGIAVVRAPIQVGLAVHPEPNSVERVTALKVYTPTKRQTHFSVDFGLFGGRTRTNEA